MDTRDAILRRIELAERQDARTHDQFFEDTLTALRELFGAELAEQARGAVTGWSGTGAFNCPIAELLRLCDVGATAASLRARPDRAQRKPSCRASTAPIALATRRHNARRAVAVPGCAERSHRRPGRFSVSAGVAGSEDRQRRNCCWFGPYTRVC